MNQMFDMINDIGRRTLDAARQLGEINLRTADRLAQQQMDLFSHNMERGVATAERLGETKDYKDVLTVQADVAKELTQATTDHARRTLEVLTEARNSLNDFLQNEIKETTGKSAPRKAA